MKLFSAKQLKEIDKCTIEQQHISSWELMERAVMALYNKMVTHLSLQNTIHIYCGKGNNGGDGLGLARYLINSNFQVKIFVIHHSENASQDFFIYYQKLIELQQDKEILMIQEIKQKKDYEKITVDNKTICIDAIFGSGINKPAVGIAREAIDFINKSYKTIWSIDTPSGLFLDMPNHPDDSIIKSHKTYTIQFPKWSFLFPENADFVGDWEIVDIGLEQKCIEQQKTLFHTIDKNFIQQIYIPRKKISSKWDYGHCLIIAGSEHFQGAAIMNVGAALRSGCGLVSLHSVSNVLNNVIHHYPECILSKANHSEYISDIPDITKYSTICFGSGVSTNDVTYTALKKLLSNVTHQKIIIDADGLNIIAKHPELLKNLPSGQTILTPHIKEFDRLFGTHTHHYYRIQKAIEISTTRKIIIVLKSAYTCVVLPSGEVYFSTYANSGLAKGGSGDILSGLITGLCARGYSIENASILGVYIHSLAVELATHKIHPESILPTDIIQYFSDVFHQIQNT